MLTNEELVARFNQLREGLVEMRGYLDLENRRKRLEELGVLAAAENFWDKPAVAREVINKANAQRAFVKPFDELVGIVEDVEVMLEFAAAETEDEALKMALAEAAESIVKAETLNSKLRLQSLLNGKLDACSAYVTIHAGAGGTESCDWASMLYRMYRMYCEDNGYEVEELDRQDGEEAGIKSVTFGVNGGYAYGYIKAERGVHRLVRISPFDANKRRHTSFTSVDVIAQIDDDIEVEIKEEDLRVDTYRSGGAGGQHVNKTDSAVRLTHLPTGIVVAVQSERSQHKNRHKAMNILKAKIYEFQADKQRKEMERFYGEKGEVAWGSQIRSYVFQPYTMVKDHRTDEQTSNVAAVMDGAIHPFLEAYLKQKAAAQSQQSAGA